MSGYDNLIGLPYIDGRQDCFSSVRNYYQNVWGVHLPNFARPDRFWDDPHLNLYGMYASHGFQQIFDRPYNLGDAVLMPLLAPQVSHAGVLVADNQLLHHLPNQLSSIDAFRPKWASRVTIHLRHPKITEAQVAERNPVHLYEVTDADILRNPTVRKKLDELVDTESRKVWGDQL